MNDSGARYPITIDPFVQKAKLTNSSPGEAGDLGASVAIAGDTIVAGAPFSRPERSIYQGTAYVFVKPASGWQNATQTARLRASDVDCCNGFGVSVAISGDTIVVGASGANPTGTVNPHGAAYVFVKPSGGWANGTETAKLTASDFGGRLGRSVAISGDTIVAGASSGGAAYVFTKPAGGWTSGTQTARLTASDGPTTSSAFPSACPATRSSSVLGRPSRATASRAPSTYS